MLIVESLLLTVLISALTFSIYSDFKEGKIKNNLIVKALIIVLLLDGVYYALFASSFAMLFLQNAVVLIILSLALYYFRIWGGGDSKLLILVSLSIPGRLYSLGEVNNSSVMIVAVAFSLAFITIILHSLYLGIKEKNLLKMSSLNFDIKGMLISYCMLIAVMQLCNAVIRTYHLDFALRNWILVQSLNFLMIFSLISLQNHLSRRSIFLITLIAFFAFVCLCFISGNTVINNISYKLFPMTLGIILLRLWIHKYCYETVPTEKIQEGQILAAATVLTFQFSRIKGLPKGVTEDLNSRITADEAASVRRWGKSAYGQSTVVVLRKIPFAIYISAGTFTFLLFEVIKF